MTTTSVSSVGSVDHPRRVLAWGRKKGSRVPLDHFQCVRKGKTTERTRKNGQPASRLLSLIPDSPNYPTLDIEAPTKMDRDKFARAFAKFLGVPLEPDDVEGPKTTHAVMVDFPPTGTSR
jgi:hypothetical protein